MPLNPLFLSCLFLPDILILNPYSNPKRQVLFFFFYSHFTHEETETEITQLVQDHRVSKLQAGYQSRQFGFTACSLNPMLYCFWLYISSHFHTAWLWFMFIFTSENTARLFRSQAVRFEGDLTVYQLNHPSSAWVLSTAFLPSGLEPINKDSIMFSIPYLLNYIVR